SRPYKSNDQAHVEERHNHVVRAFVGRDRLDTQAELDVLLRLYENLELLLNLFTSTRRSMLKVRTKSGRLMSVYDQPQRPLKRLLPYLPEETAKELLELRQRLKPLDPWFGDLEF
ncbi:MAG: transposase, partial [candidate division WOR-3 bacterium]